MSDRIKAEADYHHDPLLANRAEPDVSTLRAVYYGERFVSAAVAINLSDEGLYDLLTRAIARRDVRAALGRLAERTP